jgi:GntR family transcriptional regulator
MNLPQIDRQSAIPIYYQLKEAIYYKIKTGEWKRGQRIPSLRQLSGELKISLMTARQAIKSLVDEKVLAMHKGQGTFILGPKVQENVTTLSSFTAEMLRQGLLPTSRIISKKTLTASSRICQALELPEGSSVHHIYRLRMADEFPVGLQHSYIPVGLCPGLLEKNLTGSMSAILETDFGIHFNHGVQTIRAVHAEVAEAQSLEVPFKAPLLRVERVSYARHNQPCEYLISIYRGDRYHFTVEMHP